MLRFEDCRKAGIIRKPHGNSGALKLALLPDAQIEFDIKEPVFLLIEGKPVPFFLESFNLDSNQPILRFERIDSVEEAARLNGLELYVNRNSFIAEQELSAEALLGYTVNDSQLGSLGQIISIISSAHHDVLVMHYKGVEVLIPFDPDLFDEADEERKILYSSLPEGLVELYLNQDEEE